VPVYNLTVADAHLFYANGVLSSNTNSEDHAADTLRYAVSSRPWVKPMPEREEGLTLERLWREREQGRRFG